MIVMSFGALLEFLSSFNSSLFIESSSKCSINMASNNNNNMYYPTIFRVRKKNPLINSEIPLLCL